MDVEIQRQQHDANQKRLEAIEEEQKRNRDIQLKQVESLAKIEANTACIPDLTEKVQKLQDTDNQHRGFIAALGVLWTLLAGYTGLHSK